MEEEERGEIFQAPSQFESSRLNKQGSGGSPKKYLVIVFAIIVLILIIFGVFKFVSGSSNTADSSLTPTPTEELFPTDDPLPTTEEISTTPEPSETTTPSPKPTVNGVDKTSGLDRGKLAIHVLNGSGTAGVSKTAGDYLTNLGYNVIQVGNADNFDYTNASIQIKSSQSKFLTLLKSDLGSKYTVGSTSAALDASGRDDAVVIIGK